MKNGCDKSCWYSLSAYAIDWSNQLIIKIITKTKTTSNRLKSQHRLLNQRNWIHSEWFIGDALSITPSDANLRLRIIRPPRWKYTYVASPYWIKKFIENLNSIREMYMKNNTGLYLIRTANRKPTRKETPGIKVLCIECFLNWIFSI